MSEQVDPRVPPMPSQDQEAVTVSPEMLLAQIVQVIGPEFVVIPTAGWFKIVETLRESSDETLLQTLEDLRVPVVPVSLAPQQPKSPIIMPNDAPPGESRIIKP